MQGLRFAATRLRDAHLFDWIRPPDKTAPISAAMLLVSPGVLSAQHRQTAFPVPRTTLLSTSDRASGQNIPPVSVNLSRRSSSLIGLPKWKPCR